MSPTISSLARLTLRQLRQIASDLGVPLYSRKSKESLVDEVAVRQEKRGGSPSDYLDWIKDMPMPSTRGNVSNTEMDYLSKVPYRSIGR